MTVHWDETGKFIVGTAFNGQSWAAPYSGTVFSDMDDESSITAFPVAVFETAMNAAAAIMRSQTTTIDLQDGSEPKTYTYTIVQTWAGFVYLVGDVVQDILDLLANPPAQP